MPKTASSALIWSSERQSYELYEQRSKKQCPSPHNHEHWLSWLDTRTSFSFQGALPHQRSYLGSRECLMGNLTFQEISDPLTQRRVIRLWIAYPPKLFSANKDPRNSRESEGLCSEAWSRGWPLASAERAASTSRGGVERVSERGGERIAMHGSPPLVSASEDSYHHLGVQLWSGRVPIDDFFSPLVLKGHQESCSYLLNAPL